MNGIQIALAAFEVGTEKNGTTMNLEDLHHKVRQFLAHIDPNAATAVGPDTNLFETGLLDSLSLVQLVVFIEETLKIEIPIGDFVLDSISSVSSIYDHYVL